jgi:hypothetical protein
MSDDPTITQPHPVDDTWHEIEELIHEIAGLAREEVSLQDFYRSLLDRAVESLGAVAGAVWLTDGSGPLQMQYQAGLAKVGLQKYEADWKSHSHLMESAARQGEAQIVAPHSGTGAAGDLTNSTDFLMLLSPIRLDGETLGMLEIFQRPDTSRSAQQGFLRFLGALCELATDFHSQLRQRQMQDRSTLWGQFQQFAERAHSSLDVNETAYVLANEGRRLVGCDRLSVASRRGSRMRLRAVSGLDTFDRRSNLLRGMDKLIRAVTATGEPLWYTGPTTDANGVPNLPPQIDEPLNEYLDESNARMLAIIPLLDEQSDETGTNRQLPVGVMVVEQFDSSQAGDALRQRVAAVARQSAPALRNAQEHQSIPFLPVLKLLRKMLWFFQFRQLPKTATALILIVGAVLALALVPADFEISGTAELQPQLRRDVFATGDSVVRKVLVDQNSDVTPESVVVRLRNSELDFKLSQLLGDLQTTQQELDTVQISLRSTNPNEPREQAQYNQLAAREVELKSKLTSLDKLLAILRNQIAELDVRSPIAGRVLTWDLHKTLDARPVKRGQVLMTVADVNGPWVIEIKVADEHIGHVLAAQQDIDKELRVKFMLAANPGVSHTGEILRVAKTAERDDTDGPTVLVTVRFDKRQIANLRPGASVVPRIHCGRRPIGYVWFHELFEAVQKRLLF